jgi:hypothetical protein
MPEAERKQGGLPKYIFPIIGAAIPIAGFIARQAMSACRRRNRREARLLKKSNLDYRSAAETGLKYVKGTPIELELTDVGGEPVWEVEILPQNGGQVREVRIDAKTGDILTEKSEGMMKARAHPGHIPCGRTVHQEPFRYPISQP